MKSDKKIEIYLSNFKAVNSLDEYIQIDVKRISNSKKYLAENWKQILQIQKCKCHYCDIDIRLLQQLIINGQIGLRKRESYGHSGMHFEIEHLDSNSKNNSRTNLVACCYYCNNDKSNTIDSKIFKEYFGKQKHIAFQKLALDKEVKMSNYYRHNFHKK